MNIKANLKKLVPTNETLRTRLLIIGGTIVGLTLAATVLSKTRNSVDGDVIVVEGDVLIDAPDITPEDTTSTD